MVGGRLVKLDVSREETFVCNRVRHAIRTHIISWVRPDGSFAARKIECFSDQGAYASHGHGVVAKGMGAFPQLYPCPNVEGDAYSVFTNKPAAGAMRGYGIPQAMFAGECHMEDVARALGVDSIQFRKDHRMPVGYVDGFSKNENYADSLGQCMEKGMEYLDYERKRKEYANQTGPVRRGVGMALFWYNTAVWPISWSPAPAGWCSTRMLHSAPAGRDRDRPGGGYGLCPDGGGYGGHPGGHGTYRLHPGYGPDPLWHRRIRFPADLCGRFAIKQTGLLLKERILLYAKELTRQDVNNLDIQEGISCAPPTAANSCAWASWPPRPSIA